MSIGPLAKAAQLDLRDLASIKTFAAGVEETHGPVDIVVNNAGNTVKKPFEDSDIADFDEVMDVTGRKTSLGHTTERRTLPIIGVPEKPAFSTIWERNEPLLCGNASCNASAGQPIPFQPPFGVRGTFERRKLVVQSFSRVAFLRPVQLAPT
ncbi:short subunit dehydrogenase [Rhizobium sp. ERR 922]|nr:MULTISPECIES: SDR family NAD(P)-dependent oxidoreductase [unclassified Rhizobium]TWB57702.1 short subunit dehydrogenase [Rhizobium sp. ERR 922]TWB99397.1 short subunit dehydrogenase [Rhizobium sp. ERR 942]